MRAMKNTPSAQADCIHIPPTNVLTLAAVAVARTRYPWLDFHDPLAERVWRGLGADASCISDIELRAALGRTLMIDKVVHRWALGRRNCRVVELGSGLSTRYARMPELMQPLASIDEPSIACVRREVFPKPRPFVQMSVPLDERGWIRAVVATRATPLVVVEDAFLDVQRRDVIAILCSLAAELPSGSLLAASYGLGTRFVVADSEAKRASLEVRVGRSNGAQEIVRFPRFAWVTPPSPLDGLELPAVALLEVV
jgi:O-methyltransferase involved in polyketide biosynthesis